MGIKVPPSGPIPARVMIVGEAPGADEEYRGEPFVGASGNELTRMLHEAGISRSECFVTNVCRERPYKNDISYFIAKAKKDITHEHQRLRDKYVKAPVLEGYQLLQMEVGMVKPSIIIALGNTPLWALTGKWGITKWRGSMLWTDPIFRHEPTRVIPTYHPAAILRQWDWRATAMHDLKRAARYRSEPYPQVNWRFIVRPDLRIVLQTLRGLLTQLDADPLEISFDLETRAGHIACAGISWTLNDAISIPFMCVESREGYWGADEEAAIVWLLRALLTHPNAKVVGQNLLYDSQYTYRHWHFVPQVYQDTMITHHVCFAGLPKRLDYQASIYCDQYVYWKDDGKTWNRKVGEDQLWAYNAEDCVRTQECATNTRELAHKLNLDEVAAFQQAMFWPVLKAMQRGVRVDKKLRGEMTMELMEEMVKREELFKTVLGHPLNPRSPKQMMGLFYDDLKLPVIKKRTPQGPRPTLDDEALTKLCAMEPLIRPLVKAISEYRSLGVFLSTFVQAPLDEDDRMRCSYNICGAETYRLSSSSNAFDSGTNLQNLPKGTKAKEPEDLSLPNVRKMFVPDYGKTFFDGDLDRADLQVVVWEADDADLKLALRKGIDMHCMNAADIFRVKGIPVEELAESHPNYPERRGQIGEEKRQVAKAGVHAVNYFCKERTLSVHLGSTVAEAKKFIDNWFAAHPGIKRWHERTEHSLRTRHCVTNKYGYRRFYFDRVEDLLPEALAWIPQSTVAITINKIWYNIHHQLPDVEVLLQVHDSLAGQFPRGYDKMRILEVSRIEIPYEDPLVIPFNIKTSDKSWGDCA